MPTTKIQFSKYSDTQFQTIEQQNNEDAQTRRQLKKAVKKFITPHAKNHPFISVAKTPDEQRENFFKEYPEFTNSKEDNKPIKYQHYIDGKKGVDDHLRFLRTSMKALNDPSYIETSGNMKRSRSNSPSSHPLSQNNNNDETNTKHTSINEGQENSFKFLDRVNMNKRQRRESTGIG